MIAKFIAGGLLLLFGFFFLKSNCSEGKNHKFIAGLSFVAPPEPFTQNPMKAVQAVQADWIAVIPYAYTPPNKATVRYNVHGMQWWGEKPEGVQETIRLAKAANIKVMLKPQIYMHHQWTGDLGFTTASENETWEAQYSAYILDMAVLADSFAVDMFCIGTEFRTHIKQRPQYWIQLIAEVRALFQGKITYSANWDDYQHVPFWDVVDCIGISAYFPLVESKTPTKKELKKAWKPIVQRLGAFSEKTNKPILFTEYGYMSVDQCAWRTWELEEKVHSLDINETAQSVAIDALLSTFSKEKWWIGGFLWKWFPNNRGHEGYLEKDYTPQGKSAEAVLKRLYRQ